MHTAPVISHLMRFHSIGPSLNPLVLLGWAVFPLRAQTAYWLRSLACICRCCSLVSPYANGSAHPMQRRATTLRAKSWHGPLRHRRTNPLRQCAAVLVPDQTEPFNQPQRQVEAAAQGVVATPGRVVLSRPTPHGVIPHPHHLLDRQPQGSQVPLSDSRVCSTYFTRWASPQHAHAVQPVISHTIVMFPMPVER